MCKGPSPVFRALLFCEQFECIITHLLLASKSGLSHCLNKDNVFLQNISELRFRTELPQPCVMITGSLRLENTSMVITPKLP